MSDQHVQTLALGRRFATEVLEPMKRAFVGKDEIIDLMGVCLALSGDAAGAYDSLKRAIELQPRNRMVARQDSDLDAISNQPKFSRLFYPEKNP